MQERVDGAVDGGDDKLVAVELAGGKLGADAGRIVDREDRVDLVEAGQQRLEDLQAAVARAFGVLVIPGGGAREIL